MACLPPIRLAVLAEGALPATDEAAHLGACPACAEEAQAIGRELAGGAPPAATNPESAALWRTLAAGAAACRLPARRLPRALPWAAAVLLALGGWALGRPGSERAGRPRPAPAASPSAPAAPGWLADGQVWESGTSSRPFAAGGAIGIAAPGTRLGTEDAGIRLDAGEVALHTPECVTVRLASEGGAEVRLRSGILWASIDKPADAAWDRLLVGTAHASDAPALQLRLWLSAGEAELAGPGGTLAIHAPAAAAFRDGRWSLTGEPEPTRAAVLLGALPTGRTAWTAERAGLSDGVWVLDGRAGRASLAASDAPVEGLLTVLVEAPPSEAELLLTFPQPGGARAWVLADWKARGLPPTVSLSVAYGPWGAQGYADGRPLWTMDAAEAARLLPRPPAGSGAGVVASGAAVRVREALLFGFELGEAAR